MLQVDLVQCDVADTGRLKLMGVDTVIMNPPFGTRRKGADIDFLRIGLQVKHANSVSALVRSPSYRKRGCS